MSPALLYSSLTVIAAGLVGLFYFLRIELDHRISREEVAFLRHWMVGFFLFGLVHIPTVLINLGLEVSATMLLIGYSLSFFFATAANLLFLRGLLILSKKRHFWTVDFPVLLFVFLIAIIFIPFLIGSVKAVPTLITLYILGFTVPLYIYFVISFVRLHTRRHQRETLHRGFILMSLAWLLVIGLNITIWWLIVRFPANFWVIKLASLEKWYLARAFAHLMMLGGLWTCGKITTRK